MTLKGLVDHGTLAVESVNPGRLTTTLLNMTRLLLCGHISDPNKISVIFSAKNNTTSNNNNYLYLHDLQYRYSIA